MSLQHDRRQPINQEVVRALSSQLLKDSDISVKETIASAIGQIGKPDAEMTVCIESLAKVY